MAIFKRMSSLNLKEFRNLPITKRLLFGNMLMVILPVIVMIILAVGMYIAVTYFSTLDDALDEHFPNRNKTVNVYFLLGALQGDIGHPQDEDDENHKHLVKTLKSLDNYNIKTTVLKNDEIISQSDNIDPDRMNKLMTKAQKCYKNAETSYINWSNNGLSFIFIVPEHNNIAIGYSDLPFMIPKDVSPGPPPKEWTRMILDKGMRYILLIGIILISIIGVYTSRLLSRQILEPLKELKLAATRIQQGDLKTPINITSGDELGETCEAFESMRHNLENALLEQQHNLETRQALVAGISHDLNTPLTMIKGYASGILDGIATTPEKQRKYVEKILSTSLQMEALVNRLFILSKLDLGQLSFDMMPINMKSYLEDFLAESKDLYRDRGLRIHLENPIVDAMVSIDPAQFKRVIYNLLENTLKYKKDEVTTVDIAYKVTKHALILAFIDHGPGVKEEELKYLFERFYRTDKARTNTQNGSGLGLSIVKELIVGMHGIIIASATPGGGLTMTIQLPLIEES